MNDTVRLVRDRLADNLFINRFYEKNDILRAFDDAVISIVDERGLKDFGIHCAPASTPYTDAIPA
jgi:hypothetical protein